MADCRVIQLAEGQDLAYIQKNSTLDGEQPESLLVWKANGGWDLYAFPGNEFKELPGDTPLPKGASLDPSKLRIETVVAMRVNPCCYYLNGRWVCC